MRFMVLAKRLRILRKSLYFFLFYFNSILVAQITYLLKFIDSTVFIEFSLTFIPIIEFIRIHFDSKTCPMWYVVIWFSWYVQHKKWKFFLMNIIWFILMILLSSANALCFSNWSLLTVMRISSPRNLNHFLSNLIGFISMILLLSAIALF